MAKVTVHNFAPVIGKLETSAVVQITESWLLARAVREAGLLVSLKTRQTQLMNCYSWHGEACKTPEQLQGKRMVRLCMRMAYRLLGSAPEFGVLLEKAILQRMLNHQPDVRKSPGGHAQRRTVTWPVSIDGCSAMTFTPFSGLLLVLLYDAICILQQARSADAQQLSAVAGELIERARILRAGATLGDFLAANIVYQAMEELGDIVTQHPREEAVSTGVMLSSLHAACELFDGVDCLRGLLGPGGERLDRADMSALRRVVARGIPHAWSRFLASRMHGKMNKDTDGLILGLLQEWLEREDNVHTQQFAAYVLRELMSSVGEMEAAAFFQRFAGNESCHLADACALLARQLFRVRQYAWLRQEWDRASWHEVLDRLGDTLELGNGGAVDGMRFTGNFLLSLCRQNPDVTLTALSKAIPELKLLRLLRAWIRTTLILENPDEPDRQTIDLIRVELCKISDECSRTLRAERACWEAERRKS